MNGISRRSFAKQAVVIAGAAVVLPEALAQSAPMSDQPVPPSQSDLPLGSRAEVEARIRWVIDKHGARLSEVERADIRRLITGAQSGLDAMRAYPLDNAVDPGTPFRIWRSDRDGTTAKRNLRPVTHRPEVKR